MDDDFLVLIEGCLSDFFKLHRFKLERCSTIDSGNKVTAIFNSPICKLLFYKSVREGEVNCLVGTTIANIDNERDGNWLYLNSILTNQHEKTIQQLLDDVPDEPRNVKEQVFEIAGRLKNNFETIVENVNGE